MMAPVLPKLAAIKCNSSGRYVSYMTGPEGYAGLVGTIEENVFSPEVKVAIESTKVDSKYVHIRFCSNNKYWRKEGNGAGDIYIVGGSDQPEEDASKWSCTLFEPTLSPNGSINLIHVYTGCRLASMSGGSVDLFYARLQIHTSDNGTRHIPIYDFNFMDWDSFVILPKHVNFKGSNEKYLKAYWFQGLPYLQFSSEDGNEKATAYEITTTPSGHIRIKSDYFGKFWRLSPNWIWADSTDEDGKDIGTLFWPAKVDDNTIALRSAANNNFCTSLTADFKTECLNAAVDTITKEARLKVEELVLERDIFDVIYHLDKSRIYEETPVLAGQGTAENNTTAQSSFSIPIRYKEYTSTSFTRGVSIKAGVTTNFRCGVPFIADGKVEVSFEASGNFEWNDEKGDEKEGSATYTTIVPPMSRAKVNYIATRGKCSVPFSYSQKDRLSVDGSVVTSKHSDGVYTGVNYYSFRFVQLPFEPL